MRFLDGILPLLRDTGWPWLLAGMALLVSAGVVPSEQRLVREQAAVTELQREVTRLQQISETYVRFLTEVGRGEDTVVRRLAAAQLGVLPRGHEPLVILSGVSEPPTHWIERAALHHPGPEADASTGAPRVSMLAGLLGGAGQLWVFGASLLLIFIGLLLGPVELPRSPGPSAVS